MKKNLLFIFLILILLPITALVVMGVYTFRNSENRSREDLKDQAEKILVINERLMQDSIRQIELELKQISFDDYPTYDVLRVAMNRQRMIKQIFVIDETDSFIFPPPEGETSQKERDFLAEAENIDLPGNLNAALSPDENKEISSQWYTWFMRDGINFIFYRKLNSGIEGFLIERYALISRMIALLPETGANERNVRIQLTDARGGILYQWGNYSPQEKDEPLRDYSLSEPLGSWRLFYYYDEENHFAQLTRRSSLLIIPATALVLIIFFLAYYFYRENKREMETARKQVSFVNQVSHELKTPLTNIRLYSELLQNRLSVPKDQNYIEIIVKESDRLGRMINNVLTFSRGERGELKKNTETVDLNKLIDEILEKFRPLLLQNTFEIEYTQTTLPQVETDRDMIEQILVNVLGNAVKYGASGNYLGIKTEFYENSVKISIEDKGPGISDRERKNIFTPFYRIDNSLTQKTTGTGIGLSIAANLARETGSILKLEESDIGACFTLTIPGKRELS